MGGREREATVKRFLAVDGSKDYIDVEFPVEGYARSYLYLYDHGRPAPLCLAAFYN